MVQTCHNCGVIIDDTEKWFRDPGSDAVAHLDWQGCIRSQKILINNLHARMEALEADYEGVREK